MLSEEKGNGSSSVELEQEVQAYLRREREPEVWPDWFRPVLDYYRRRAAPLQAEIQAFSQEPNGEAGRFTDSHADVIEVAQQDETIVNLLKEIVRGSNVQSLDELQRMVQKRIVQDLVEERSGALVTLREVPDDTQAMAKATAAGREMAMWMQLVSDLRDLKLKLKQEENPQA